MNRLFVLGIVGWIAFGALGACQGPDAFYRPRDASVTGGGGHIVTGAGGSFGNGGSGLGGARGSGGSGVGGSGAGGSGLGGARGTGGTTGGGGTAGSGAGGNGMGGSGAGGRIFDGGTNCISTMQQNGYAAPPAMPCSACMENSNSLAGKCTMMIDCLAMMYPCITGNCRTNCLNMVSGSGPLSTCVDALVSAACGP